MSSLPGPPLPWDMLRLEGGTHYRQVRQPAVHFYEALPKVAQFIPMPRGGPSSTRPADQVAGQGSGVL